VTPPPSPSAQARRRPERYQVHERWDPNGGESSIFGVVNLAYVRKNSIDAEVLNDYHLKPHHRAGAR
jgi:hypothetical protein